MRHYSQPRLRKNQSMADEQRDHRPDDDPEGVARALAGHADVHPPDARDERQRQDDDADRRQRLEDVVDAMRQHRLVRRLQALDDLLEVLEHVPDALRRVVDVVEVDVQALGDVALRALEVLQRHALRADDLAEVDDLLLDVGDVAHDLARAALPDLVLQALELVAHLREHRKRRVDAVVDDLVEQVAGALGEQRVAHVLARLAALEEVLQRLDRLVGQRDDEVRADEDVELGGVQAPDRLVEAGEVQDDEEVVVVLVDLRALVARVDVLVVEMMELEVLLQPRPVGRAAGARCGSSAALRPRRARRSGSPPRPPGARRRARDCGRGVQTVALEGSAWLILCPSRAGHIQRGGGTGPTKPRQPTRSSRETVPIPVRCGTGHSRRRHGNPRGEGVIWRPSSSNAENAVPSTRWRHATCARSASDRWRSTTTTPS